MITSAVAQEIVAHNAGTLSGKAPIDLMTSLLTALAEHRSRAFLEIPTSRERSRSLLEHAIQVIESSEHLFLAELCHAVKELEEENPVQHPVNELGTNELGTNEPTKALEPEAPSQSVAKPLVTRFSKLDVLSEREFEIATLVTYGLTSIQIAKKLEISYFTVDAHLKHIYRKLSIGSRAQLTHLFDTSDVADQAVAILEKGVAE